MSAYDHCQNLLFLAMGKCGRYEAIIEYATLVLQEKDPETRQKASEYISKRLSEIKLEHEQKIKEL